MADTLQFELVSPERKLASVAALRVTIPGMSGDMTAMPNHAPFLTTLRPGVVRIEAAGETVEFVVTGGFAEVSRESATILAEQAVPRDAGAREMIADLIAATEKEFAAASDDLRQQIDQRLRDARHLGGILGA
ncbi:ATP synthase F1 subunit epsilon [Amaricoccus sp.]|uniref:ATP synthase F1 subunit epsilon n=1 Tax=Amaricoccus sp. TaxID=1872485 RepID=UPI001B4E86EB|nr:ATP synthase F1 subunit epsilon [Amaricoccus sp.]MBP7242856.1 ATP synthase F1 subunit epsilon [Amaricoccus sp.]